MRPPLFAAALLLTLASGAAGATYVPRADVEAAARGAALQAKQLDSEQALIGELQQARWNSVTDPLRSEARMMSALQRLRDVVAPTAASRAAVSALLDYASQTLTDPVDVEQRRQVPAFAISAAARAALTHWQLRADAASLRKALNSADLTTLAASRNTEALADVIGSATPLELTLLRDSIAATPGNLHALFLRLADPQLALDALRQGAGVAGLALIADIPRVLTPAAALATLSDGSIEPGYRSAARLALSPLVATLPAAREFLLSTLGDVHGDSSAAALGRSGDADALAALADIVATGTDTPRLRHALLGLRASGAGDAQAALAAFADDPRADAALRQEVRAWLR
ncbi:MAG TPA: hypothetical protein VGE51_15505 [Fontimonas sp.]